MPVLAILWRFRAPLAALALILALVGGGYAWKAHSAAQAAELARLHKEVATARYEAAIAQATVKVVTKYVDRVKVVEGRTRTIIKEIPVYVPANSPDLGPGFRVLHDAAALGALPDPARIADAAPVPAQAAAETILGNYGTCQANDAQLSALQDWIRAQQAVSKP